MSDDQKAEPNPQVIKLRKNLEELGLSTLGNKKTLSRRLKAGKAVSSSSSSPQAAAEEVDATKTTTTTGLANSDRQTTTTNSRRKSSQQRQCAKEQHAYKYFLVFGKQRKRAME